MAGLFQVLDSENRVVFAGISHVDYVLWKDGTEEFLSHFWPFIVKDKMDQVKEMGVKFASYNIKEDRFFYATESERKSDPNTVSVFTEASIPKKYKVAICGTI